MKSFWVGLCVLAGVPSASAFAVVSDCFEIRGVLDIGSGATKMKVAKVDHCLQKVVSILAEDSIKVGYSASLKKSTDQNLSPEIQKEGLTAIETLMARGNEKKPVKWFGFATSAFRTAKNGAEVIASYAKKTTIKLKVITQDQEGSLGFAAGVQAAKVPAASVVVWDIGGGSQQFAFKQGNEVKVIKLEDKASEKFKEIVIQSVKKESAEIKTPNPIGEKNLKTSVSEAKKFALDVKFPFVPKQVIGIGGVHAKSFEKTLKGKSPYSVSDLARAVKELSTKTDTELKDDFADTQVSNLILVQGMMEQLKIKFVTVSPYGGAEGALVYPDFWK